MTTLPAPHEIATDAATGAAYAHGAQVVAWAPAGQPPVLWLSPRTELTSDKAIRGGIPVCFPWFGPGRTGDRTPAHGFARTADWHLVGETADSLTFELTDADVAWQPFVARLTATFAETLTVSLAMTNRAEQPVEVEAALHTYLSVGDVRQVGVQGLDGVSYVDKVDGGVTKTQAGGIRFEGETDRVYASTGPVEVVDPVLGRTIRATSEGATKTVVWNPGEEKGTAMADVLGWDSFCCVEAACALDGAVTLAPGATHTLTQRLAIA